MKKRGKGWKCLRDLRSLRKWERSGCRSGVWESSKHFFSTKVTKIIYQQGGRRQKPHVPGVCKLVKVLLLLKRQEHQSGRYIGFMNQVYILKLSSWHESPAPLTGNTFFWEGQLPEALVPSSSFLWREQEPATPWSRDFQPGGLGLSADISGWIRGFKNIIEIPFFILFLL